MLGCSGSDIVEIKSVRHQQHDHHRGLSINSTKPGVVGMRRFDATLKPREAVAQGNGEGGVSSHFEARGVLFLLVEDRGKSVRGK